MASRTLEDGRGQAMEIMIPNDAKAKILSIWDDYIASNQTVLDTKGNELNNIDALRLEAIDEIMEMVNDFRSDTLNIHEFKSALDGYNKRNNLWGFTATKGQMFFNQLVKNEDDLGSLTAMLQKFILEPSDLSTALATIKQLETHVLKLYSKAADKRTVAKPSSVSYFLSYFWQIHDPNKWPIYYTSLIEAFSDLGIWKEYDSQSKCYEYFYQLNESIKKLLATHAGKSISNWDAEHAFWLYKGNPNKSSIASLKKPVRQDSMSVDKGSTSLLSASFVLSDYLIPKVANLVELGADNEKSAASKGHEFEKKVSEVFNLLDFEVEMLGQGSGRNPDAIVKCREQNTAFILDAKAYSKGYALGLDDRAIKEYINHHCPKLAKNGYKRIGFIIVSNSFKSNFDGFINEITWSTEIKRFILLTTEALLYLLAYKIKGNLTPDVIIDKLVGCGNPVDANGVIQDFDEA